MEMEKGTRISIVIDNQLAPPKLSNKVIQAVIVWKIGASALALC
jgi:hypothetical protein